MSLIKDYIDVTRLRRPIGIWLLLFPGCVGLTASAALIPGYYWGIFLLGAVVMRSAGCIYNDIIDRPFDGKVHRTQHRPLVRRQSPLSLKWAIVFLILNSSVGLWCLLQLNATAIYIGLGAAAMILAYPWMKRITYWPQLFLGLTMNMGFVMGWAASGAAFRWQAACIYAGLVAWTLGYDTIYGFQDMEDDATIGVKSAALKVNKNPKMFLYGAYGVALLSWLAAGVSAPGLLAIGALLYWQVHTLNINDATNCLMRFKSNQYVGILLWLALI